MENTSVLTNTKPADCSSGQMHMPPGYQAFVNRLKEIGVNPDAAIKFLRAELIKLAREKKQAGYTYQEFQDHIYTNGFECVYYP